MSVTVQIDVTGLDTAKEVLAYVGSRVLSARPAVLSRVARQILVEVRAGYQKQAGGSLAAMTLAKRRQGKRAGLKPAIQPVASTSPFKRTGRFLVDALEIRRGGPLEMIVGVSDLKSSGPDGTGYRKIAAENEFGDTLTVPITRASAAYLSLLRRGRAGGAPASAAGPSGPAIQTGKPTDVVGFAYVPIPARPVWGPAFARVAPYVPTIALEEIVRHMQLNERVNVDARVRAGLESAPAAGATE